MRLNEPCLGALSTKETFFYRADALCVMEACLMVSGLMLIQLEAKLCAVHVFSPKWPRLAEGAAINIWSTNAHHPRIDGFNQDVLLQQSAESRRRWTVVTGRTAGSSDHRTSQHGERAQIGSSGGPQPCIACRDARRDRTKCTTLAWVLGM
ncbi:hypothetical protein M011DRAFT_155332 [Sporormia fimetaria CBS 119925]|uniref:Uncharacterized protein n=1 Tax=Sporormia fimetaria CBS 119925 TaxID=1340428 RepID=A0A6A6V5L7_9PLEO|nr:hypothetical protein M011DRAFT_155332 [Sporormia fimetaria CBS 119925]